MRARRPIVLAAAAAALVARWCALSWGGALDLLGGGERMRRWVRGLGPIGPLAAIGGILFASRLVSFIVFDAVSYAAGLPPLRGRCFALATLAGVIPVGVALVWFGDRMVEEGAGWIGLAVLLLGGVTLLPLAFRLLGSRRASVPADATSTSTRGRSA